MLTIASKVTAHSPFVMCMGSMAAVTYLSALENRSAMLTSSTTKDRIRVFLGILKKFENIWPQAKKWSQEIKLLARPACTASSIIPDGLLINLPNILDEAPDFMTS